MQICREVAAHNEQLASACVQQEPRSYITSNSSSSSNSNNNNSNSNNSYSKANTDTQIDDAAARLRAAHAFSSASPAAAAHHWSHLLQLQQAVSVLRTHVRLGYAPPPQLLTSLLLVLLPQLIHAPQPPQHVAELLLLLARVRYMPGQEVRHTCTGAVPCGTVPYPLGRQLAACAMRSRGYCYRLLLDKGTTADRAVMHADPKHRCASYCVDVELHVILAVQTLDALARAALGAAGADSAAGAVGPDPAAASFPGAPTAAGTGAAAVSAPVSRLQSLWALSMMGWSPDEDTLDQVCCMACLIAHGRKAADATRQPYALPARPSHVPLILATMTCFRNHVTTMSHVLGPLPPTLPAPLGALPVCAPRRQRATVIPV